MLISRRAGWRMDWHWAQRERVKVTHHNKDLLFFLSIRLPFFFLPSIPLQSCCLQPISFHFKLPSFVSYACSMCFSTNLQHLGYWSWYVFMVANKYNATIISSLLLFLFFFIHYLLPASFLPFIPGWILISVMPSFCYLQFHFFRLFFYLKKNSFVAST